MGLLDWLRKRNQPISILSESVTEQLTVSEAATVPPSDAPIAESDKKYYQPDEYYTKKSFEGTVFEKTVITFEERKKVCVPSESGLYVAEILLLSYCAKGKFPCPQNGYQAFWWFEYGIRNVGAVLEDLENRGYIFLRPVKECVDQLTVAGLKELLTKKGLAVSGKKAELALRAAENIPEEELINAGVTRRYSLTVKGQKELDDNAYVQYCHANPNVSAWTVNRLLGTGDKSSWRTIIEREEKKFRDELQARHVEHMKRVKEADPELYKTLKAQDDQIELVNREQEKYKSSGDVDGYIAFWENLWNHGGLVLEGTQWHFELAELYIKQKRYDDALRFLRMLKKDKPSYSANADEYIGKVVKAKEKAEKGGRK